MFCSSWFLQKNPGMCLVFCDVWGSLICLDVNQQRVRGETKTSINPIESMSMAGLEDA